MEYEYERTEMRSFVGRYWLHILIGTMIMWFGVPFLLLTPL